MNDAKRQFAVEVVRRLQQQGHCAFWAGGCVRDHVMGFTPDDYDVATSAHPEQIQALFPHTFAVGASFGVIIVIGRKDQGQVEVATFRTEGAYSDGRHPDQVRFSSPQEDAFRRDFTINGMFFDPIASQVHDYVGGRADIEARVIRAIGQPRERFHEDKLRLLRAVRFAARFEFHIDPATESAVRELATTLVQPPAVSPERIQQELRRMLVHVNRTQAIVLADQLELLEVILPEVAEGHGVPQGKPMQPHGDLWEHMIFVMEKLGDSWRTTVAQLGLLNQPAEPSFALALGTLLHDIGKPRTMSRNGDRLTFYHHEHVGFQMASQICRRLRLSNDDRERVEWLVEQHMYLSGAKQMRLAKLKRMLVHPGIAELLALHRADALASTGSAEHVEYCEQMLRESPHEELNPPAFLTGHDLVRAGLEPGPLFKELIDKVREAQLDGSIRSKKDALAFVRSMLNGKMLTRPDLGCGLG
jgi:poly(A) polymerase